MDPTLRRHLFCFFMFTFPHMLACFRHYEKLLIAVKTKKLQLQFLHDCLQEQVLPRSLQPAVFRRDDSPFPDSAKYILQESIQEHRRDIDQAYYRLRGCLRTLRTSVPQDLLQVLWDTANYKCGKEEHKQRVKLNRKLSGLCSDSVWGSCGIRGAVLNLSSYVLSKVEKEVLSLGLSFAMKPDNNIALDFVSATVNNRQDFPCVSGIIVNGLLNHFNSLFFHSQKISCRP